MLVLTRKVGESIKIGNDIRIVVHRLSDKRVRLGIQAPKEVSVHREEVSDRLQLSKASASTEQPPSRATTDNPRSNAN